MLNGYHSSSAYSKLKVRLSVLTSIRLTWSTRIVRPVSSPLDCYLVFDDDAHTEMRPAAPAKRSALVSRAQGPLSDNLLQRGEAHLCSWEDAIRPPQQTCTLNASIRLA